MINENKALLRQLFEDVALDRQGELEFRCRLVHGAMVEIPITLDATFNEVESRSNKFLRGVWPDEATWQPAGPCRAWGRGHTAPPAS
ncbi:hypothetical protein RJ55_06916 [Drechmeria coniospora]|nr:hypothetical protein RJ55_06916 [Drechmeria coniospora]